QRSPRIGVLLVALDSLSHALVVALQQPVGVAGTHTDVAQDAAELLVSVRAHARARGRRLNLVRQLGLVVGGLEGVGADTSDRSAHAHGSNPDTARSLVEAPFATLCGFPDAF